MSHAWEDALRRAALDRRLLGRPLRVFAYLLADLDFEEFRPVKLVVIGQQLRLAKGHVSTSLRLLVNGGHLEQGPLADRVNTFRLALPVRGVGKVPPEVTKSPSGGLVA